jgi:hypothetical protein
MSPHPTLLALLVLGLAAPPSAQAAGSSGRPVEAFNKAAKPAEAPREAPKKGATDGVRTPETAKARSTPRRPKDALRDAAAKDRAMASDQGKTDTTKTDTSKTGGGGGKKGGGSDPPPGAKPKPPDLPKFKPPSI